MSIANISLLMEEDYTVEELMKELDGVYKFDIYRGDYIYSFIAGDNLHAIENVILHSVVKTYEVTKRNKQYYAEIWIQEEL